MRVVTANEVSKIAGGDTDYAEQWQTFSSGLECALAVVGTYFAGQVNVLLGVSGAVLAFKECTDAAIDFQQWLDSQGRSTDGREGFVMAGDLVVVVDQPGTADNGAWGSDYWYDFGIGDYGDGQSGGGGIWDNYPNAQE